MVRVAERMGKAARQEKRSSGKGDPRQSPARGVPNWPLLGLTLIGMSLTGYLTATAWTGEAVVGCSVGSGCDIVLTSRWSKLLGEPTAFWGFLTYLSLAGIAWIKRPTLHWKLAWVVSLFGVLYSVYLTTVALVQLQATCPYCLTSAGLMISILGVLAFQQPRRLPNVSWRSWLPSTTAVCLLLVLGLHLHYSGAWGKATEGEDPTLRALAIHLAQTGAKFYGASWCPHCQEQKTLFGASAQHLPYVECSPEGRFNPQAPTCRRMAIRVYPTWTINGRRYEGLLPLTQLAAYSGFSGHLPQVEKPPRASPTPSTPAETSDIDSEAGSSLECREDEEICAKPQ